MILQALKEYYDRKEGELPPVGWIRRDLDYDVILGPDGSFHGVTPRFTEKGRRRERFTDDVPAIGKQALKHDNSGKDANLLWDRADFALGCGEKGKTRLPCFIATIEEWLGDCQDAGVAAVLSFLRTKAGDPAVTAQYPEDVASGQAVVAFRLQGEPDFIYDRPAVKQAIGEKWSALSENAGKGLCLITGESALIEPCHTVIKGVWGGQPSGGTIVGFNADAFCSYNKTQGANAPASKEAAFAYTTALNHLLGSRQRVQVGDASTVFWASKDCDLEQQMPDMFGDPPKDDPDRQTEAVRALYRSVESGAYAKDEGTTRFYVLGLAPNAGRIAVRFWIHDTVANMAARIRQHFEDTKIVHGPNDPPTLSLFRLLVSTAVQGKADNIPPTLGGDTMRAILEGLPYPRTLLQAAIRRARAEQDVIYARAALIKACVNRETRRNNTNKEEELAVSLDEGNTNIGYRLGRLFAALERIQQDANPGINATIRDRFYGAASSTPVTVFGNLMRLTNHHLSKLEKEKPGLAVVRKQLLGEIMCGVPDFPAHLTLADQGRFAIGYYHQTRDFWTSKADKNNSKEEQQ